MANALVNSRIPDDDVAEDVQRLARELLPRTRELATTVTQWVLDAVPEVAPGGTDAEIAVVHESTEQNIGAILSMLAFGVVPGAIEPPPGTLKVLHQTVAGGNDLVTVLRAFRIGHASVSRVWLDHVGRSLDDGARLHAVTSYASERLFVYFDGACERLASRYREEFPAVGPRGADSRRRTLDRLIAGEDANPDAAAATLGYELRRHHVAVVATPSAADGDARAAIDAVHAALDGRAILVQPVGYGTLWAWIARSEPPSDGQLAAVDAVAARGVVVGVGDSHPGLDGLRRTHLEALDAHRFAGLRDTEHVGDLARHHAIELAALLCHDPRRARRLAAGRLGALAARDDATTRLRDTVRTFLRCGLSKARTAEALHVHQKTVAYRLARAERLLGAPLPADTTELEAALLIDATLNGS